MGEGGGGVAVVGPNYTTKEAVQLLLLFNQFNHNRFYLSPISLLEEEEEIHRNDSLVFGFC